MAFSGVLKGMFPFISAAASLGGPLGTMAASAVGKAIGVDKVDSSPEGIAKVIAGVSDPTALAALQKAEQDFQVQMAQLGYKNVEDILAIDAADRASARARQIAVKDRTPTILAFMVVGGFLGMAAAVLFHKLAADSALIGTVIGYLSAKAEQVVAYYFGSSAGSTAKTALLAQAQPIKLP